MEIRSYTKVNPGLIFSIVDEAIGGQRPTPGKPKAGPNGSMVLTCPDSPLQVRCNLDQHKLGRRDNGAYVVADAPLDPNQAINIIRQVAPRLKLLNIRWTWVQDEREHPGL